MLNRKFITLFTVVLFLSMGCVNKNATEPYSSTDYERGDIIRVETLSQYTSKNLNLLINLSGYDMPYELEMSVTCLSIVYQTVDHNGINIEASGALNVPNTNNGLSLVSIQHGTQTKQDLVASVNPFSSPEGIIGLCMSSMGYLTCIPDYIGFGVSSEMHPYINGVPLAISVIDFLRAVNQYCSEHNISLNNKTYLVGYSEGGYATLATQKEIEQNYSSEFTLTGVAPMAGPYDMTGTMKAVFQNSFTTDPVYIAFLFTAWDNIYEWDRLDEFFKSPYASRMQSLFDGSKTWSEISNQLPSTVPDLVKDSFIQGLLDGTEIDIFAALKENTLLNWQPQTPIRFYHGDADEVVPYQNSLTAVDSLTANGAVEIDLVTIPGGTHSSSGFPAFIDYMGWLINDQETAAVALKF